MRNRWFYWCCIWTIIIGGAAASAWPGNGPEKGPGNEPGPTPHASREPQPIKAKDCVVKLIDEVTLSSERAGILGPVAVKEGDLVTEGQLLATLKDDVARAALAVAEIEAASDVDIRFAQNASEVAAVEYEKVQEANKRVPGTVPGVEVRRAKLASDKTVLEIEKAQHTHEVQVAKRDESAAQLASYRIEAPFDGFVTRVLLSRGAAVRQGDGVIELVSTKKVRVEGFVKLKDALVVRSGAPVRVELEVPGAARGQAKQSFPGKIVFVDVKATPVQQEVRVWAEVDNDATNSLRKDLNPEMTIYPAKGD
jgi:multidrug efflux pump subunit AcrA (membrane-fusion protein)